MRPTQLLKSTTDFFVFFLHERQKKAAAISGKQFCLKPAGSGLSLRFSNGEKKKGPRVDFPSDFFRETVKERRKKKKLRKNRNSSRKKSDSSIY